jgi:hypothetical protein
MRLIECEQGSPEWLTHRLGVPSASQFSKIVTGKGGKSTQVEAYINQLVAEELTGETTLVYVNEHMKRGTELEPDARELYEALTGQTVQEVGFCLHDTVNAGCSPDGLIGEEGGLEIKCPAPATHVEWVKAGVVPSKHLQQIMGCLWVTGRSWWDFMSYHQTMKPLIVRVERDEEYIAALAEHVTNAALRIKQDVNQYFQ